jgi:hypothetical protein
MANSSKVEECFKQMDPKAFYQLGKGVERCLRVRRKLKKIQQDYDQQNKRYKEELALYFEHWKSFTRDQLFEFCKNKSFTAGYFRYLLAKAKMQDEENREGQVHLQMEEPKEPNWGRLIASALKIAHQSQDST